MHYKVIILERCFDTNSKHFFNRTVIIKRTNDFISRSSTGINSETTNKIEMSGIINVCHPVITIPVFNFRRKIKSEKFHMFSRNKTLSLNKSRTAGSRMFTRTPSYVVNRSSKSDIIIDTKSINGLFNPTRL